MGRELKRVPLGFEWPRDKVWKGFINPHSEHSYSCGACSGRGDSPEAKALADRWYGYRDFKPEDRGSVPLTPAHPAVRKFAERNVANSPRYYGQGEDAIVREAQRLCELWNAQWSHHLNADDVAALLEAGRLMDLTHTWSKEQGWLPKVPAHVPTPEEVNTWAILSFGHDSINCWTVVAAEAKRLGIETTCSQCKGEGTLWRSEQAKADYDAWEREEPPQGEGYQVWETVSEGSPISPVFDTPEGLAAWMTRNPWGSDDGTTYEQWLAFIRGPGWAPSFISDGSGTLRPGVAMVTEVPD